MNPARYVVHIYGYAEIIDGEPQFDDGAYDLIYDRETKGIYKVEHRTIGRGYYVFITVLLRAMLLVVDEEIVPFDNLLYFIMVSLIAIYISIHIGYRTLYFLQGDAYRIALTQEEWEYYLKEGNKKFVKQIYFVLSTVLVIFICIVCFYIFQSNWWLFGALLIAYLLGTMLPLVSKTRYLFYKGEITPDLNLSEYEDENIFYW